MRPRVATVGGRSGCSPERRPTGEAPPLVGYGGTWLEPSDHDAHLVVLRDGSVAIIETGVQRVRSYVDR